MKKSLLVFVLGLSVLSWASAPAGAVRAGSPFVKAREKQDEEKAKEREEKAKEREVKAQQKAQEREEKEKEREVRAQEKAKEREDKAKEIDNRPAPSPSPEVPRRNRSDDNDKLRNDSDRDHNYDHNGSGKRDRDGGRPRTVIIERPVYIPVPSYEPFNPYEAQARREDALLEIVAKQMRYALRENRFLKPYNLDTDTVGDSVEIEGTVDTLAQMQLALDVARNIDPRARIVITRIKVRQLMTPVYPLTSSSPVTSPGAAR